MKRNLLLFSLCTLMIAPVTPVSAQSYTVVQGDSLYKIAKLHHTTPAELMRINNLTSDLLQIGQTLQVQAGAAPAPPTASVPNGSPAAAGSHTTEIPADLIASTVPLPLPQPSASATETPDTSPASDQRMTVTADRLNVRSAPSLDSSIVDKFTFGSVVEVKESGAEWTRIAYGEQDAYVATEFLAPYQPKPLVVASSEGGAFLPEQLQAVISPLMKTPYVLGGATPAGFDCSGFTWYVFQQFGINLPRTSEEQFLGGTEVALEDALPGDLMFYDALYKGKVSHVSIYLGNGLMVHANGSDVRTEKVENMHKLYKFYGVKRYAPN